MSVNEDAAKRLLSGAERIAARAAGESLTEYAREHYGTSALLEADDDGPSASETGEDALALQAMDGADRVKANAKSVSPAAYLRAEYDVDPRRYSDVDELHNDILAELEGQ
ncbi:hypothetical protein [Haloprofundus halophilus]|uniref:hypothetical protein n=1 Tax=Haloprofundus halophilus TaxID=2283527 RepID=UPI000E4418C2|nr:hypothetical protein [Haloprofundus halophilus]